MQLPLMRSAFACVVLLVVSLSLTRGRAGSASPASPAAPRQTVRLAESAFRIERDGAEARVTVRASAPGRDWGSAGRESAAVAVLVDGQEDQRLVLYGGMAEHDYELRVGPLPAGEHRIEIVPGEVGAVEPGPPPRVLSVRVRPVGDSARDALVWKHAPLLYGRKSADTSDTPLILFYELYDVGPVWRVVYSVIWSNEDGGTGTDVGSLVARWGRTTDIEWVYEVSVDRMTGAVLKATYQGAGHGTFPFRGEYRGSHPVLYTVTRNNMVGESGPRGPLFALAPLRRHHPERETREAVMDDFPWTHAVAAREMEREGRWESPGDPATPRASDSRNYLNVDYRATVPGSGLLAAVTELKSGARYFSDHGRAGDAIGRSGWVRTTVELPPGTTEKDVARVGFVRRDSGPEPALVRAGKAFFLGADYRPRKPFRRWSSAFKVEAGGGTFVP